MNARKIVDEILAMTGTLATPESREYHAARLKVAFEGGEEAVDWDKFDAGMNRLGRAEAQADGAGPVGDVLTASSAEAGWTEQAQRARKAERERDKALADLAEAKKDDTHEILCAALGLLRVGQHGRRYIADEIVRQLSQARLARDQMTAEAVTARAALEAEKLKVSEARRESLGVIEKLQGELAKAQDPDKMFIQVFGKWYSEADVRNTIARLEYENEHLRAERDSLKTALTKREEWLFTVKDILQPGEDQPNEALTDAARRVVKERDEARQAEVLKATCPHCRQPVLLLAAPEDVK